MGRYKHYKGKNYKVIGTACHSETLEQMVVYQALYETPQFGKNAVWVRPLDMFLQDVEIDNKKVPRFKYVENEN